MAEKRMTPILVTGAHRSGTTWVGKMLAADALTAARDLYDKAYDRATDLQAKVFVLSELAQTTHDSVVLKRLIGLKPEIVAHIDRTGAVLASAMPLIRDKTFNRDIGEAVKTWQAKHAGASDADFKSMLLSDPDVAKLITREELEKLCSLDFHFKEVKQRFKKLGL